MSSKMVAEPPLSLPMTMMKVKSQTKSMEDFLALGADKRPSAGVIVDARDALQKTLNDAVGVMTKAPAAAGLPLKQVMAKGNFTLALCELSVKDPARLPSAVSALDTASRLGHVFDITSYWKYAVAVKALHGETHATYLSCVEKIVKLKPLPENAVQVSIHKGCVKILLDAVKAAGVVKAGEEAAAAAVGAAVLAEAEAAEVAAAAEADKAAAAAVTAGEAAATSGQLASHLASASAFAPTVPAPAPITLVEEVAGVSVVVDDGVAVLTRVIPSLAISEGGGGGGYVKQNRTIRAAAHKYYTDLRWQRFDIGRLLAQQYFFDSKRKKGSSERKEASEDLVQNVLFAPLPVIISHAWWRKWCKHVGGFNDSTTLDGDVKTWLGILNGGECLSTAFSSTTDDYLELEPVVLAAFAAAGLSAVLPIGPAPTISIAAGQGQGPGPVSTSLFLDGGEQHSTSPCWKTCTPAVETDSFEINDDIFTALRIWYETDGPAVPSLTRVGGGVLPLIVERAATDLALTLSPLPANSATLSVKRVCCLCGEKSGLVCVCKIVLYCDSKCQRVDWDKHKPVCKKLTSANGEDVAVFDAARDRRNGLVGLNNIGNTCYMGSALQALSAVWPLSRYYVRGDYEGDKNLANKLGTGGAMSDAYADLVKSLWLGNQRSYEPRKMLVQAAAFQGVFSGAAQQDAQELLNFVVDGLHEDCNKSAGGVKAELRDQEAGESDSAYGVFSWDWHRSLNDSRIVDLFGGQFKSTLSCPNCLARSVHFDYFNMVQLPMPDVTFKDVSIVLRRLQPGLSLPEAFQLPTADAPASVKKAWDDIAAHAAPLLERFVVRVNTRGGRVVPADEILEALSKQCGLPAGRLFLHQSMTTRGGGEGSGDLHDFFPAGCSIPNPTALSFSKFPQERENAPAASVGEQGENVALLFATEVFPADWASPFSVPNTAAEAKSAEIEAFAADLHTKLGQKHAEVDAARARVGKARQPGRRVLLITRLLEPRFWNDKDVPVPVPKVGTPFSAGGDEDKVAFVCIVSTSADMPLAVVRMHMAAALFPLIQPHLRASLVGNEDTMSGGSGSGSGGDGPVPGHALLRVLASKLLLASDVTLPSFLPRVSAANASPTTLLGHFDKFQIFNKLEGMFPDVVWAKLHCRLRSVMPQLLNAAAAFEAALFDAPSAAEAAAAGPANMHADIVTSFRQYLSEEGLDDDNKWLCPGCKQHVPARKTLELWKLPAFIIASFKRFKTSTFGEYRARKATQLIDFPLVGLDLSEIDAGALAAEEELGTPLPENRYDCLAVVNQMGQLRGGHYTAFINHKVSTEGARGLPGEWYHFDDSKVEKCAASEVVTPAAYIVIYQKQNWSK